VKKIYKKAIKIRAAEEQLLLGYKNRDFGGTVHTCIGQELLPSMLSEVICKNSFVISNHRGHGHFIAHSGKIKSLFREFLAKEGAPSKGVGGSQHLYDENFLSNGIQGCTAPFAVGVGLVQPTVYYLGDGTFGEGALYEALNLAKLTKSHLLLVVEDNEISQSTPSRKVLMGPGIPARLGAFGIECVEVDSADPYDMYQKIQELSTRWSSTNCIALVCKSYRLRSHSKGDDTRDPKLVEMLPDPLEILAALLEMDHKSEMSLVAQEVAAEWDEIKCENDIQFFANEIKLTCEGYPPNYDSAKYRINHVIRNAISKSLENGALFIGEDVVTRWDSGAIAYGGAFGVSMGLSESFKDVIGTSISEVGLVGVAAGRAFASGKLSIAEIMFADFSTLIVDQLHNGVDKYKKMFGVEVKIPLIIRLPYGMGRGYGPTHSQTPMEVFSGLTEVVNVSYTPFIDYEVLINRVQEKGESAIIHEPKVYYGDLMSDWFDLLDVKGLVQIAGRVAPSFFYKTAKIPAIKIISHGSAVKSVLLAIKKYELACELIIVGELYSDFNYLSMFSNFNSPLVVIEEKNSSFGALFTTIAPNIGRVDNINSIFCNSPVKNIPACAKWESDLMITPDLVNELIKEALL
jgi:2-oxoisovalerate dehydrogenase E1 component